VQKAVAFAKKAHHGQLRKTGDPYLTHCIHTGRILAMLVPSSGKRVCNPLSSYYGLRFFAYISFLLVYSYNNRQFLFFIFLEMSDIFSMFAECSILLYIYI
jgi:hypothetical protein